MNYVVDSYENYKEENRLTTNNARRIEFVTTTRVLDEIIGTNSKILDCAAGTGIYAFWFADKGHDVTAKGSLMGECWYKDCCVSEHPNNLRCGKPEVEDGNEKMRMLVQSDEV